VMRYYCDGCGVEVKRSYTSERFRPTKWFKLEGGSGINIAAEVMTCVDGTWNAGHLCKTCLLRVLNEPDMELRR
jgi:hypothetical protein